MEKDYKKTMSWKEVEDEIKIAEAEKRNALFSGKTIQELNLSERNLKCGFDFKETVFLGDVYLGRSKVGGELMFDGSIVKGTLYLGEVEIKKGFSARKITVKNSLNMVKGSSGENIDLEKAHIQGFLSLNNAKVKGNINLKEIKTVSLETPTGTVRGDLFMKKIASEGFINLEMAQIAGLADLEEVNVWGHLNMTNTKIQEVLMLRNSYIKGKSLFDGMECERKIVSF